MSEALGLYVHVPFCEAKCTYCYFAIDPRRPGEDRQERYLRALLAEVEAAPAGRAADTLYLGGGTPTLLALDRLERLVAALRRRFRLGPAAEVTVEANPRDLDRSGYRHLAGLGVNHNGKYWDDAPFLGFGMAAHSYEGGRRWWNHEAFGAYCREVEDRGGGAAVAGERVLGGRERAGEALFTGLRRAQGVPLGYFRERYGFDPLVAYAEPLRDAFAAGLLEVADDRLRLTPRGVLLSNEVFRAFV